MAQTKSNEKKISLLKKRVARAQFEADMAQSELEIAQGKYKTFKSAKDFMRYMERKYKLKK